MKVRKSRPFPFRVVLRGENSEEREEVRRSELASSFARLGQLGRKLATIVNDGVPSYCDWKRPFARSRFGRCLRRLMAGA